MLTLIKIWYNIVIINTQTSIEKCDFNNALLTVVVHYIPKQTIAKYDMSLPFFYLKAIFTEKETILNLYQCMWFLKITLKIVTVIDFWNKNLLVDEVI